MDVGHENLDMLRYRYKHSIVETWGSYELQKLLMPDFPQAGEDELALLYLLAEDLFTPSPLSSATEYFFSRNLLIVGCVKLSVC